MRADHASCPDVEPGIALRTYEPVAHVTEAAAPVASNNGLCRSSYGVDALRQLLIIQK